MAALEWIGAFVGLVYLWLEYRASIWLWLASIVMPAVYIFVYYESGFYADMGINVYYLAASVYGWLVWVGRPAGDGGERETLPIRRTPVRMYLPLSVVSVLLFVLISWVLVRYTDSDVPYGDAFTTALSVAALWMLARKYVEQWLVWLVVDVACCILYVYKGLYPTAALYGLYGVIAMFGYYKWLDMMKKQNSDG